MKRAAEVLRAVAAVLERDARPPQDPPPIVIRDEHGQVSAILTLDDTP